MRDEVTWAGCISDQRYEVCTIGIHIKDLRLCRSVTSNLLRNFPREHIMRNVWNESSKMVLKQLEAQVFL